MKKIAVLLTGSMSDRKGLVNAELSRLEYLKKYANYQIDAYAFQRWEDGIVRVLRHTRANKKPDTIKVGDILINLHWRRFTIWDYMFSIRFHLPFFTSSRWMDKIIHQFAEYDLITAHSRECGELALKINNKYSIPYFVTWHGSDVHTAPFESEVVRKTTKAVMDNAAGNFFVSKMLLETSKNISTQENKILLYNGVSSLFQRYDESYRTYLRQSFHVFDKKVVAFAGNLIEVKNPQLLPEIFMAIHSKYDKPIEFWVIGDGKWHNYISDKCAEYSLPVRMFGNQPVEKMPSLLNCVDVLVLPSRNEGLPLITIEAIKCGANVVGANVGGVGEAIGVENVFDHGETFVEKISDRAVYYLNNCNEPVLDSKFSWEIAASQENEIYQKMLEL